MNIEMSMFIVLVLLYLAAPTCLVCCSFILTMPLQVPFEANKTRETKIKHIKTVPYLPYFT